MSRIETVEKAVTAMAKGTIASHKALEGKIEQILKRQAEDIKADREVIEVVKELCQDLKALVAILAAPKVRESTINLPSGPVSMTVREAPHGDSHLR